MCFGGVVLAMALAGGTANDWLPLIMVDGHSFGATVGSLVFALSAAGDSGPNSAARVALASVIGCLAFLVGPPTLGFLGEEIGLRGALVVPLAVAFLAALLSPATAARRPSVEGQPE